jgi:alcohol dehydrogenase (cytochrome c)
VLALVIAMNAALVLTASAARDAAAPVPAPAFTPQQTIELPGENWIGYNGNGYNTRHSTLNQVTAANVGSLRVAWRQRLTIPGLKAKRGPLGTFAEGTPVVYGGVMYMPDSQNNVWAIDAQSGERIWIHRPKVPKGFTPVLTSRGVVIGDGKVYFANGDATISALNQSTGRVVWKKTIANYKAGYSLTNAPLYYDGKIITGTSGGDSGARAFVTALNAKTGRELWRFYVIPAKRGDPGFSSWPRKRAFLGGGAMWNTPAVDPRLNLVYLVVGNPIPYSGNKRGAGKELFTDSLIALDTRTGKLRWHYQFIHHDIWDYDPTNPVILFDLQIGGQQRQAIAHAGKTGWVYILDRATGKPILPIRERKVPQLKTVNTYPTQPYPVGDAFSKQCPDWKAYRGRKAPDGKPYRIGCIFTPYDHKRYVVFAPDALGGANWPPSAYSPDTGYMYICSKDGQAAWKAVPAQRQKLQARGDFSQIEGLQGSGPARKKTGRLVAMNMRTNRIVWQKEWSTLCYSGVMSTAGGLVFVGRNEGFFEAYDARNGRRVWRSPKLRAGVNAAPTTYTVNGKQYIAVFAGGNGIASAFGGVKPYYGASLYAFALPG